MRKRDVIFCRWRANPFTMSRSSNGSSVIDRLNSRYEDVDVTCPECGYVDEDSKWTAETNGRRIDYRHLCPSCGNMRTRTVRLDD